MYRFIYCIPPAIQLLSECMAYAKTVDNLRYAGKITYYIAYISPIITN